MSAMILNYSGPPLWGSYNEIWPVLVKVWKELGIETDTIWFPNPKLDEALMSKILKTETIVFPLGIYHIDALKSLELLRIQGFNGRAVIMCAGAGMQGAAYLKYRQDALRSNDILIVNSPREKDLLEDQLGKIIKIISIPLPVNQKEFCPIPSKTKYRKLLSLKSKQKYLLYAGRISAQKNLLSTLSVFSELRKKDPSWKFLILGLPDDVGVPHMQNQNKIRFVHEVGYWIQKLNLQDHVEFKGQVSQRDLAVYMKASDAFISLTLHHSEDFGYSVAQAVSSGLPTVITNWGGGAYFNDLGMCQGVSVFATPNGPRIAYDEALKQLLNLKKINLKKVSKLSIKNVSVEWRKVLKEKISPPRPVKFNPVKIWQDVKLPYFYNHPAYLRHALIYGAIKPKGKKWYKHPQYVPEENHLLDPISFVREISHSSEKELKDLGILLPYL